MKRIWIVSFYILMVLTACTPSGIVSQTPASEDSSQEEATQFAPEPEPEEIPAEDRIATITPVNGDRICRLAG